MPTLRPFQIVVMVITIVCCIGGLAGIAGVIDGLLSAAPTTTQTRPTPPQIAWPAAAEPMVLIVTPGSPGLTYAKIDPATLAYDPAKVMLYAKPQPQPVYHFSRELIQPTTNVDQSMWRIPAGCNLVSLHRNGVLQSEGVDYGPIMNGAVPWLAEAVPDVADTVTAVCAR